MEHRFLLVATALLALIGIAACTNSGSPAQTKLSTEEVRSLLDKAKVEITKKNYGSAIEITVKVTESDPKQVEAHFLSTLANASAGSIAEAIKSLEKAIDAGFSDVEKILNDDRFVSMRADPAFPAVIARTGASAKITTAEVSAGSVSIKQNSDGSQVIKAGDVSIQINKN